MANQFEDLWNVVTYIAKSSTIWKVDEFSRLGAPCRRKSTDEENSKKKSGPFIRCWVRFYQYGIDPWDKRAVNCQGKRWCRWYRDGSVFGVRISSVSQGFSRSCRVRTSRKETRNKDKRRISSERKIENEVSLGYVWRPNPRNSPDKVNRRFRQFLAESSQWNRRRGKSD